ncbi:MAG: SIR2 family protein [Isosphaeraceae bacterium]|nr:SIR2 family protein [Isosphaeraceae bacterium]
MPDLIQELATEVSDGHVIAFLGAGSALACESGQGGGATGQDLARDIIKHLGEDPANFSGSLMEVSEFLEAASPQHRRALDDFVYRRLKDLRPTVGHLLLPLFPWRALITTNYNQVIERGFAVASQHGITTKICRVIRADSELTTGHSPSEVPLYKPHGCLGLLYDHNAPLVLTARDYYNSTTKRKRIYDEVRELAGNFSTLFIGYSLVDYNFNNIYYELGEKLRDYLSRSYSVGPVAPHKKHYLEQVFQRRDIKLIDDKFDSFVIRLADKVGVLAAPEVFEVVIAELSRPEVLNRLGSQYINELPSAVRNELVARGRL